MNRPLICGTPESILEAAASSQWPRSCMDLNFWTDWGSMHGMSSTDFLRATQQSLLNCTLASGLDISLVTSKNNAHIQMTGEPMSGGILAYAYLPNNNCGERLQVRFNSNVDWDFDLYLDTLTHELGHTFGLPHTQDDRDIMYPSLIQGRNLNGKFGPYFSLPELTARYGRDIPNVPIPPDPPSPPEVPPVPPIPWDKIIELIITLIRDCRPNSRESLRAQLNRPSLRARLKVRRFFIQHYDRSTWRRYGNEILQAVYSQAEVVSDNDLDYLLAESKD